MNSSSQNIENQSYVTFRDLVLSLRNYTTQWKSHKSWIFACIAVAVCIAVFKKVKDIPYYEAEVSFMLNEDNSQSTGLSSLLGQFGGVLGGSSDINLQKILELARTRKIAEKVFFTTIIFEGKSNFLGNFYVRELERQGEWLYLPFYKKDHPLKGFEFKNSHIDSFTRLENLALKQLHALFLSSLNSEASDKTGIMKLRFKCPNEMLSYEMTRQLFQEMSDFYVDKSIEKQSFTYLDIKHRVDSLKALIERKEYGLAGIKDSYRSTWLYREEVPKNALDREIRMLSIIYAEALKNQEIASFSLENKTPFIQAIDLPILPLKQIQLKWTNLLLIALFSGLLAGILIVSAKSFYAEQMNGKSNKF